MSRHANDDGIFVNTGYLRDHVDKLDRQRKTALKLYESVASAKSLCDPATAYQYDNILNDIERLIEYYTRMVTSLSHVEYEAYQLSTTIGGIIEDDTQEARHKLSNSIML